MKQKYVKTSALEVVHPKVYVVRGQKVILDRDLAVAFGVETKLIKRNVKSYADIEFEDEVIEPEVYEKHGMTVLWCCISLMILCNWK